MTGPKHLWSGDWERESAASRSPSRAGTDHVPPVIEPARRPAHAATGRRLSRTGGRQRLGVALVVLALGVAGLVVGVIAISGSGSRDNASLTASDTAPITVPALTRTSAGPAQTGPIHQTSWLGMTIVTGDVGRAVVESVAARSAGARAGVRPGDEIVAISGHAVSDSSSLAHALRTLRAGERVAVRTLRGSETRRLHITLSPADAR